MLMTMNVNILVFRHIFFMLKDDIYLMKHFSFAALPYTVRLKEIWCLRYNWQMTAL